MNNMFPCDQTWDMLMYHFDRLGIGGATLSTNLSPTEGETTGAADILEDN